MIRFVTKPDPQPKPPEAEDDRLEQIPATASEEDPKSTPAGKPRRARQAVDGDRLL